MWSDLQRVIYLRTIEETDRENPDWSSDRARAATQLTQQRFPKAASDQFLLERSKQFQPGSSVPELQGLPSWIIPLLFIAAFVIGWSMSALGQEREINLLALPLIALLAWNFLIISLNFYKSSPPPVSGTFLSKLFHQQPRETNQTHQRFYELARPIWTKFLLGRSRTLLHLAAAILALGSITGMYGRGWSKEYRAVWESTILTDAGATTFFSTLFHPASLVLQIPVPKDQIPAMRRGVDQAAKNPSPALPWIHLYAGTLGIFIILPRLCLVLYESLRQKRFTSETLRSQDWQNYTSQLLALIDGAGATIHVLVHSLPLESSLKDQWRMTARQYWPDMGSARFITIPAGSEADFVENWTPPKEPFLLLVFNLASVPEIEVHRWLVEAVIHKWSTVRSHPTLTILLDETALHQRWSGFADYQERLAKRRSNWQQTFHDLPVQFLNPSPALP